MKVKQFSITGAQLLQMNRDDRVLFLQLSSVGNSIAILQKWMLFAFPKQTDGPKYLGALAQQMLVTRTLAGVLNESWEFLRGSFFGTKLSGVYEAHLGPEASKALKGLKEYFKGANAIRTIRNNFAFHVNREAVASLSEKIDPANTFPMIVGIDAENCLFWAGEEIGNLAFLDAVGGVTGGSDREAILDSVYSDVVKVARHFSTFISGCLVAMLCKHFPNGVKPEHIDIAVVPTVSEVEIPFFVRRRDSD